MDYGRIWRIAKTPVILLGLLGLVALAGSWGYAAVTAPLPPPNVPPCVDQPVPEGKLKSEMVTVRVLNASNKRGKAAEVSRELKRKGFNVSFVGNADDNQEQSEVVGVTAEAPEVQLVAAQFQGFAAAGDSPRKDHSVEVFIGQDYESMIGEAPTELQIDSETICLPALATAQPL